MTNYLFLISVCTFIKLDIMVLFFFLAHLDVHFFKLGKFGFGTKAVFKHLTRIKLETYRKYMNLFFHLLNITLLMGNFSRKCTSQSDFFNCRRPRSPLQINAFSI